MGAIERLGTKLDEKIEKGMVEGRGEMRRVYDRIDRHARESQAVMTTQGLRIERLATELRAHREDDERQFREHAEAIRDAGKDRKGLWKFVLGAGGAGAFLTQVANVLTGKGGT